MKELPIIMSAESVQAILDERKTVTRRVVTGNALKMLTICSPDDVARDLSPWKVGNHLWVKEDWKPGAWRNDGRVAIDYMASPELTRTPWAYMGDQANNYITRWLIELSDIGLIPNHDGRYEWQHGKSPFKWKRAMYMPRFASRILLEITNIRVERVQDITEEDAIAEGIISDYDYAYRAGEDNLFPCPWCNGYGVHEALGHDYGITEIDCTYCNTPKKRYRIIWDSLNAKRGYPWKNNDWVWRIEFRKV